MHHVDADCTSFDEYYAVRSSRSRTAMDRGKTAGSRAGLGATGAEKVEAATTVAAASVLRFR